MPNYNRPVRITLGDAPAAQGAPQTTPPPPGARGVPGYAECFKVAAGTNFTNILYGGSVGSGMSRLDPVKLRCVLLTQNIAGLDRRILDLDNYIDCRYDNAPDRNEILNEAVKAGGFGDDIGFLNEIIDAIQDAKEAGESGADDLGPLESLLNAVGGPNWPRAGSYERLGVEVGTLLSLELSEALAKLLSDIWPVAKTYIDDTKKIIRILVDAAFFIGDYFAEAMAARREAANRILSYYSATNDVHPYGIGRTNTVKGAYNATYGVEPSMVTVKAWCDVGKARSAPYTAPDGTDGQYQMAMRAWQNVTSQVENEAGRIGLTPKELLAGSMVIAGWYGGLQMWAVRLIGNSMWNALRSGDRGSPVIKLPACSSAPDSPNNYLFGGLRGYPSKEEVSASTFALWDERAAVCNRDYYIPWWESPSTLDFSPAGFWANFGSLAAPIFGWKARVDLDQPTRLKHRQRQMDAMSRVFAVPSLTGYQYEGKFYPKQFNSLTDRLYLATVVTRTWDVWFRYARAQKPYSGARTIHALVRDQLLANIDRISRSFDILTKMPDSPYAKSFTIKNAMYLMLTGVAVPLSQPKASDYPSPKGPCPTGDAACLPCETIKGRRPLGAKVIQIPTVVQWTQRQVIVGGRVVPSGPKDSPEFAAWQKNLRDNGYPGYYIDCLARDLTFVAKNAAPAFNPNINIPRELPGAGITLRGVVPISGGASGLTAQSIALLNGGEPNKLTPIIREFSTPPKKPLYRFDPQPDAPLTLPDFRLLGDEGGDKPSDVKTKLLDTVDDAERKVSGLPAPVKALLAVGVGLAIVKVMK